VTCRVPGLSGQAFYQWRADPVSRRDGDDAHLINAAVDIHHDDPEFGYRFITDELAGRGPVAGRDLVNRLCTRQRRWPVHPPKRGTGRRPGPPVHDDLVRGVGADAPNQLSLTDLTGHPTAEGTLYLCAVRDACTNRIVGYSMGPRRTSRPRWCAPAGVPSSGPTPTPAPGVATGSAARWARSGRARTTPPWSRSPRCRTRTSPTGGAGRPASSSGSRSWSGSKDLPPPALPRHPRPAHAHRVRDTPTDPSRGLTAPTRTTQRKSGQSRPLSSVVRLWGQPSLVSRATPGTCVDQRDSHKVPTDGTEAGPFPGGSVSCQVGQAHVGGSDCRRGLDPSGGPPVDGSGATRVLRSRSVAQFRLAQAVPRP
jgi:hypothetical protein